MKLSVPKEFEDSPEMMLAWLLRDIHQMTQSKLSQNLARYGLYVGQPRILRLIQYFPGETQKQIADRLFVSPASLSTSIKRLRKAKLVEQRQSKTDLRQHELYLTPAGEEARKNCTQDLRDLHRQILRGLDDQSVDKLIESLKHMHNNLKSDSVFASADFEEDV